MRRNQMGNWEMSDDEAHVVLHCLHTAIDKFKECRGLSEDNERVRDAFGRYIAAAQKIALALE